jgi:molybdopterin synthase sulfur carrier subunit
MEVEVPVEVTIPTILRSFTGGERTVTASGSTIAEVISDLDSKYSGIKERVTTDGGLHRFVNVYVNDDDVRYAGGLETPVSDGDTVTILPAVAGGA